MRICMRTTMIIDDDLLRQAKKRAAEQGLSVSDVVNRALRESFARQAGTVPLPPFRMVTFGRGQPPVDHQPAELARAFEEEDERRLRGS
jgi:hypothetical protein